MEKNPYDIESEVESFHWWFVVRRKLLKSILSIAFSGKALPKIYGKLPLLER